MFHLAQTWGARSSALLLVSTIDIQIQHIILGRLCTRCAYIIYSLQCDIYGVYLQSWYVVMTFPNTNHHEWNCFDNISLSRCRAWIGSLLSHRDVLYTGLSLPHLLEMEYAQHHLLGQEMQRRSKWMQYYPQMMSKGGKQITTNQRFDMFWYCRFLVDLK